MSEFDILTKFKPDLNAKTIVNYRNLYKRLKSIVGDKDITSLSQDEIIKSINEVKGKNGESATPSVKTSLLSLALVLRESFELNVAELKKAIKQSREDVKTHVVEVVNPELKEELPSLKELNTYLDKLYTDEDWRSYIMNYLMITYGVRNKDLDLEFVNNKSEMEPKKNYLMPNGKGSIKYVREDYKTVQKWREQELEIKSKKFMTAVKHVMDKEGDNRYLLSLGHNHQIAETSLNKYVSKHTLNNMGQAKIYKAVIASASKVKTEKMSGTRGTAMQTTTEHYDVNHKARRRSRKITEAPAKATEALKVILEEAPKEHDIIIKKKTNKAKKSFPAKPSYDGLIEDY